MGTQCETVHQFFIDFKKALIQLGGRKQGSGENYIMRSLMICTPHLILFR